MRNINNNMSDDVQISTPHFFFFFLSLSEKLKKNSSPNTPLFFTPYIFNITIHETIKHQTEVWDTVHITTPPSMALKFL